MSQDKEIAELKNQVAERDQDIERIAVFVFKTLQALGVKDFSDIDNIGKKVLGEMPGIATQAVIMPHRLQARFAHFGEAKDLLVKYKHFFPAKVA